MRTLRMGAARSARAAVGLGMILVCVAAGVPAVDARSAERARGPEVACDRNGNAMVAFGQYDGADERVYASRYDGSGWQAAEAVDLGPGSDAYSPGIAFDQRGNAIAVFYQNEGAVSRVYARRFNGSAWEEAVIIDAGTGASARDPDVAFDGDGNAVAVFYTYDGSKYRVYANRYAAGVWGAAARIDAGEGEAWGYPRIACARDGTAMAVFEEKPSGGAWHVYAAFFNGAAWGAPFTIENPPGLLATSQPQVAFAPDGSAIAVFSQHNPDSNIYARLLNGASPGAITRIDAQTGENAWNPQIACDASGAATAVFSQNDGTCNRVYASGYDGALWHPPVIIDNGTSRPATLPEVVSDGTGATIAVFSQPDGTTDRIYANRYSGAAWGGATVVDAGLGDRALLPRLASDGAGTALTAYEQYAESKTRIFANRFGGAAWSGAGVVDANTPHLEVVPSALAPGARVTLRLTLREAVGEGFSFYLLADTPLGTYTLHLDGRVEAGIHALYDNVPGYPATELITVAPNVALPQAMAGQWIAFYAAAVRAGTMPPVSRLSEVTANTQNVILLDKKTRAVGN